MTTAALGYVKIQKRVRANIDFINFPATITMRTNRLIVPSCIDKIFNTGFLGWKSFKKIYYSFEVWLFHIFTLNNKLNTYQYKELNCVCQVYSCQKILNRLEILKLFYYI